MSVQHFMEMRPLREKAQEVFDSIRQLPLEERNVAIEALTSDVRFYVEQLIGMSTCRVCGSIKTGPNGYCPKCDEVDYDALYDSVGRPTPTGRC